MQKVTVKQKYLSTNCTTCLSQIYERLTIDNIELYEKKSVKNKRKLIKANIQTLLIPSSLSNTPKQKKKINSNRTQGASLDGILRVKDPFTDSKNELTINMQMKPTQKTSHIQKIIQSLLPYIKVRVTSLSITKIEKKDMKQASSFLSIQSNKATMMLQIFVKQQKNETQNKSFSLYISNIFYIINYQPFFNQFF
ncbi:transmembrane protein, putative (macronuclear) [Tetrahymena thermophila SB210]|uniref:Transmembrane protein, putative n=1 Tax=Tetrahymena thermophila (strain SB210) TaxID=312017 RepID=I7MHQ6_TETTS|nr:transmembrane protein, putative [Tetrahymena thermophila SB210]EAR89302.2 transmembrane protein, putative [Tetrahymena thermophila SB210]|eukprot:XP_001009547.2 transmembrane protein, putative [Tetrahymena thermophila SB210]